MKISVKIRVVVISLISAWFFFGTFIWILAHKEVVISYGAYGIAAGFLGSILCVFLFFLSLVVAGVTAAGVFDHD